MNTSVYRIQVVDISDLQPLIPYGPLLYVQFTLIGTIGYAIKKGLACNVRFNSFEWFPFEKNTMAD